MTVAALVIGGLFVPPAASAATITASSCAQTHVQAAVNAALDGDLVAVPAGNCTWASHVAWENKNIWVRGAGIGQTVITRDGDYIFYVGISNVQKGAHRISDMTLRGNVTNAAIKFASGALAAVPSGRWRVDHVLFDFPTGQRSAIHVGGVNYGVIDHNTFNWHSGIVVKTAFGLDTECYNGSDLVGDFANQQPLDLGTDKFVFVEDNTFIPNRFDNPLWVYDATSGGGRVVFRYNTATAGQFYNHWTRGCEMAAQVFEIYNNTWIVHKDFDPGYPMRVEAGTGVFFNNFVQGYNGGKPYVVLDDRRAGGFGGESSGWLGACDGTKSHDGNAGDPEAPGWPCLGQIGRAPGKSLAQIRAGDKPASAPFYFWNNGQEVGCANGGVCNNTVGIWATPSAYIKNTPHPNGEVDYVDTNTPKPGYTPFVYPHPLVSSPWSSSPKPAAPTNVRIVVGR
jgi:hypothetical protein